MNGTGNFTPNTRSAILFIESVAINPDMRSRILDGFLYRTIGPAKPAQMPHDHESDYSMNRLISGLTRLT